MGILFTLSPTWVVAHCESPSPAEREQRSVPEEWGVAERMWEGPESMPSIGSGKRQTQADPLGTVLYTRIYEKRHQRDLSPVVLGKKMHVPHPQKHQESLGPVHWLFGHSTLSTAAAMSRQKILLGLGSETAQGSGSFCKPLALFFQGLGSSRGRSWWLS